MTMQKTFEVAGPVELEIKLNSGAIDVDATGDSGQVEVELIAHDEASQELIDNGRVELQQHQQRPHLVIDLQQRRSGGGFNLGSLFGRSGISCRVRVPSSSSLTVRTKSADVAARGTLSAATVATASGDVELDRVEGNVNVKSASADLRVREVTGGVNVQSASGDVEIDVVRGPVSVASASGDVTIREAYNDVNTNTVSGDQEHGAVLTGRLAANSVSGDVHIGVRRGSKVFLDCNTVSGDTSSELDVTSEAPAGDGPMLEIRAKTVSGDILITRAPAPADDTHQEVHA
jgi:DUF4097 and DUF4098 domain-containing protein YvlB